MTDWFVYRCEEHKRTTYVNANPRPPLPGETPATPTLCCGKAKIMHVADEHEFCIALLETRAGL